MSDPKTAPSTREPCPGWTSPVPQTAAPGDVVEVWGMLLGLEGEKERYQEEREVKRDGISRSWGGQEWGRGGDKTKQYNKMLVNLRILPRVLLTTLGAWDLAKFAALGEFERKVGGV